MFALYTVSSSCVSLSLDRLFRLEFVGIASLAKCYPSAREKNEPKHKGLGKGNAKFRGMLWTARNLTPSRLCYRFQRTLLFAFHHTLESGFDKMRSRWQTVLFCRVHVYRLTKRTYMYGRNLKKFIFAEWPYLHTLVLEYQLNQYFLFNRYHAIRIFPWHGLSREYDGWLHVSLGRGSSWDFWSTGRNARRYTTALKVLHDKCNVCFEEDGRIDGYAAVSRKQNATQCFPSFTGMSGLWRLNS